MEQIYFNIGFTIAIIILVIAIIILKTNILILIRKVKSMANALDVLKGYAQRIDAETNEIAAMVNSLQEQLAENAISPEQIQAVLEEVVSKLEVIGTPATLPDPPAEQA